MEQYKDIQGKWEFSKNEKSFIDFCEDNNYQITECKQYISKTKWKFKITESIIESWETYNDVNMKFGKAQLENFIFIRLQMESNK